MSWLFRASIATRQLASKSDTVKRDLSSIARFIASIATRQQESRKEVSSKVYLSQSNAAFRWSTYQDAYM